MMGYDEPTSKRQPAVYGASPAAKQRSPWRLRILLGVIALGVGAYFGFNALSKNRAAVSRCPTAAGACGDPDG